MGKRLMLAVAGSGKTTYLISLLNLEQRFLLVTYTRNNYEHLKRSVIRKFGYFPDNIKVLKYFQFVYSFCYKPFCGLDKKTNGICFKLPPEHSRYRLGTDEFYRTKSGRLYHNRIAHYCSTKCADGIKVRLDKYYDYFLIDEVQDFAGHDFNLLLNILPDRCETICVGDFFQHTYDTSLDGNVRSSLYKKLRPYIKEWEKVDVEVDTSSLAKTRRCSNEICEFVTGLGISIESTGEAKGSVFLVDDELACEEIINNSLIPKLFLRDSGKFYCAGLNWGASKGMDHFVDVCVVLNKSSFDLYKKDKLNELNPQTKNKLYVACTRAHRNLYVMSYKWLEKYKLKKSDLRNIEQWISN